MKKKYMCFTLLLVAAALLIFFAFGIAVTRDNYQTEAENTIRDITAVCAAHYTDPGSAVAGMPQDVRLSVIAADGTVLADSVQKNVAGMENHRDREEILAAAGGHPATVVRYSASLGNTMVYYAERVDTADGYVFLRAAIPVQTVRSYVTKTVPFMVTVMAVVLLVSALICGVFMGNLLDPIRTVGQNLAAVRTGEYHPVLPDFPDDEINRIVCEINDISATLQKTLRDAETEKLRLDYILDHVSEGIVAWESTGGKVDLCNAAASALFGVEEAAGLPVTALCADAAWMQAVSAHPGEGKSLVFELNRDGRTFACTARPLENGLTVAVLTDITVQRENERIRSEFFANASHELKTPLTAIKGFNDMIGMRAEDERVRELSAKIGKEADRMISLIGDMLKLSRLEEGGGVPAAEPLELSDVVNEVTATLAPVAAEKKVTVTAAGTGRVTAEREHMVELVKNLLENAIRYNRPGGHAGVTVTSGKDGVTLSVKDDGIGIGEEDQSRIFERFYRVSKSRSRETGGTGLGLAIVKHICQLYNAELHLHSRLGEGTEIAVFFPVKP